MSGTSFFLTKNVPPLTWTTVAALSVLVATAVWWRSQQGHRRPFSSNRDTRKSCLSLHVSPAVLQLFQDCAARIRRVSHLADSDKLFLYALYKQATIGDAPRSFSPSAHGSSWNIVASQAKYYAWRKLLGMARDTACYQYIAMAQIHLEEYDELDQSTERMDNRTELSEIASGDLDDGKMEDDWDADDDSPQSKSFPKGSGGGMGVTVSRLVSWNDAPHGKPEDATVGERYLQAAASNDIHTLHQLVESHPPLDLNHKDEVGQTALHMAADNGALDVLQYLLEERKVDINAADNDGISVLQTAVIAGQVEACRLLLKHGADPDLPDHDGDTPRGCAADDGPEELQQLFRSTGRQ